MESRRHRRSSVVTRRPVNACISCVVNIGIGAVREARQQIGFHASIGNSSPQPRNSPRLLLPASGVSYSAHLVVRLTRLHFRRRISELPDSKVNLTDCHSNSIHELESRDCRKQENDIINSWTSFLGRILSSHSRRNRHSRERGRH